jgi:choline dehydrogenase
VQRERFDVAVVGGGTAGCVLAARLSEDTQRRVCLVEAGPDYGPYTGGRWPADLLDARALAFSHSWETDREDRSQLRARVIGGCSAHNACVVLAGSPADYDEWGHGWTYAEFEPYLRRARDTLETRVFERAELSPWHAAFAQTAAGAIVHEVNARETVRWHTGFAYLDPARARPNLTILADALADRVLLEAGRAVGVATSAGDVSAEIVVLACGAYGSPGVLLRSGIEPETGLPVGQGLLDHVGVGFGFEPTDELQTEAAAFAAEHPVFMAQVTVPLRSTECPDDTWDLFGFPAIEPVGHSSFEISAAVFAMKPRSRGSVRLAAHDPRAPLLIDHGFLEDDADAEVLAAGVDQLRALVQSPSIARYVAREVRPGPRTSAVDHVRSAARGFFHPTGTCAIGRVVDQGCRVLGYDGLVVADASVMPTIPRVNTNLTTAAIAERVAELLSR